MGKQEVYNFQWNVLLKLCFSSSFCIRLEDMVLCINGMEKVRLYVRTSLSRWGSLYETGFLLESLDWFHRRVWEQKRESVGTEQTNGGVLFWVPIRSQPDLRRALKPWRKMRRLFCLYPVRTSLKLQPFQSYQQRPRRFSSKLRCLRLFRCGPSRPLELWFHGSDDGKSAPI